MSAGPRQLGWAFYIHAKQGGAAETYWFFFLVCYIHCCTVQRKMVFNCKGFYFDEEEEAFRKNSAEKRAEELPVDEKSKKPRGSRAKRVVPVANADTLCSNQTEYDGADDQSKKTFKAINDLGGANSKNGSRRSRVAPDEDSFEEQKPQNFEQFHPWPPKGNHRSDDKKPKEKIENPSAENFLDESVLLRILHCNCDSCRRVICRGARKFKGVSAVSADTSTDLVRVTGKMDVNELLIHLKKKLKKNVEVVPAEKADYLEKDREYDRNTDKMIDNLSSKSRVKKKVEPAKLEEMLAEQNSENSELSLRQLGGNHGSDFMEPHQKIEISGNQKTHKEGSSPLHLRIRMHCTCGGCTKKMKDIFKRFKGVDSVKVQSDKDMVRVTGTLELDKLVVYLEEKLKRNVEVIPTEKDENGASPSQIDTAGVGHIVNITDNASRKKELCPDVQVKKNLEKTELTLPRPRERDRNDNEVTGMVHLKIRMHCHEGCIPQTRKTAMEFTGVKSVKVDASKHLVIMVGAINVKELVVYLKEKLNRSVEVIFVQNDNVAGGNKDVEVNKIETLKEPAAARADGRNNKDAEIKKEVKKLVKDIKIKKEVEDVKEEDKKYSLCDGGDGTKDDKEDKKGSRVDDKVQEAKGHGCISHVGEKHKELEAEGENQTYYQNYGEQLYPRYEPSDFDYTPGDRNCGIQIFSDENPHSCAIM
ncbi:heavy metal-associated isoprenylated plant protein 6-like isoform X3 [Syzygium oleosum]|uniref:heavy metal-associated isoprenylated plant protein 6-like isoform X3 n=1 Tax=Syzygium oleosum TaxID=219896 RepID=UPI0024BBD417|nr:heavy metal-associated isoprenylated plant protein 6-like isoform X3 [Syzygium oleosum]